MTAHPHLFRLALAALGLAALPALAADPGPSCDLKIHGGTALGDLQRVHQANKVFGFAVAGRFPLAGSSAFTLELGFDFLPGRDHDVMPLAGPLYVPAGTVDAQGDAVGARPLYLDVSNSIDFRKESSQGLSLRGSYSDKLPGAGNWYWFAGASLDFYKTTAQFSGTLNPQLVTPVADPADESATTGALRDTAGGDYYEGWAFVHDHSKLNFGVLAGVGVPMGDYMNFEFTVRNLGLTHVDYRPYTYTGRPAALEVSSKRGFTFEIGISLKI